MDHPQSHSFESSALRPRIGPTTAKDRIESLDVLRGLALFMILAANMDGFNSPIYYLEEAGQQWWTGRIDHIVQTFINMFIQGESVALFSFLFGLGFAMLLIRAKSQGSSFILLYVRRLAALIVIGLIHAYLIWMGDILILYGLLGFLLLLFRNLKPKLVLALAIILYLVPPMRWELSVIRHAHETSAAASSTALGDASQEEARSEVNRSVHAYSEGTWSEITAQRARDYYFYVKHNQAATVFPLFLFGLYAGQRRWFENVDKRRHRFRSAAGWSFIIAILGSVVLRLLYLPSEWAAFLRPVAYAVEHAALVVFYISAVVTLHQDARARRLMAPLAAAGRLALSNYLLQSVICTLIFYRYGLGLYGKVGPAVGFALALVIFGFQVYLSALWSRRFQYGPVEWLWRSITYGHSQTMRI